MSSTAADHLRLSPDKILRAVNIVLDAEQPERISHFVPTAKTARLVGQFMRRNDNASYFVVAPYGSGKSLTATFYIQAVENVPRYQTILKEVAYRFERVDGGIANTLLERIDPSQTSFFQSHGIGIALSGFQSNLPRGIQRAIVSSFRRTGMDHDAERVGSFECDTMDQAIALLASIRDSLAPQSIDRIAIVWDEFGRHLEEIVSHGLASSLNDIQLLAEFAARTRRIPITFILLLHQGFMRYASNISLSVQQEWRKIEGRFETIQFVDDSNELYELVAEIVQQFVSDRKPSESVRRTAFSRCRDAGLFNEFDDEDLLTLLSKSYPVEPTSLFLLPRVSSRVAQNERTLFTFLYDRDDKSPIGPESIFDYFSESMRADTSVGGTYHNWLETQSALTKTDYPIDARTLKCACLLGLGLLGERSRVNLQLLSSGVAGYGAAEPAEESVKRLIGAKLLLYRKNTDSVTLWHGTDIDLRGKLEEEKRRLSASFDLVSFLDIEVPPPIWKPIEHNNTFFIERHFACRYISAQELLHSAIPFSIPEALETSDGIIYSVVPETDDELVELRRQLVNNEPADSRILVMVPLRAERIFEVGLEVHALYSLSNDSALIAEDPLVKPELEQMIDDAQGYLSSVLDRLYTPSPSGPVYFHQGHSISINSRRELRSFLSSVMDQTYPLTPKINNELIIRRKPRPVIVNARKKLLLGILERSGMENMGLEGYKPDMSMFRTVLLHTGLYQRIGAEAWTYAEPGELSDPALSEIWDTIRSFLTRSNARPKSFRFLLRKLERPPFGVRAGVIPILLAAAMRAFPSALSITRLDGTYVRDVLPTTVEDICTNPAHYVITVVSIDDEQKQYLEGVYRLFAPAEDVSRQETDLLRRCYDAVVRWRSELPVAAFTSSQFSSQTRKVQVLLAQEQDPYILFLKKLPSALGRGRAIWRAILTKISESKHELEGVVAMYYSSAKRSLLSALGLEEDEVDRSFTDKVSEWAQFFPDEIDDVLSEGLAKAFLSRVRIEYESEESLLDSVCSLIIGKRVNRWDDSTITLFEREAHALVSRIEESILSDKRLTKSAERMNGVRKLAGARFKNMYHRLVAIIGISEAEAIAEDVVDSYNSHKEHADGHTIRSSK